VGATRKNTILPAAAVKLCIALLRWLRSRARPEPLRLQKIKVSPLMSRMLNCALYRTENTDPPRIEPRPCSTCRPVLPPATRSRVSARSSLKSSLSAAVSPAVQDCANAATLVRRVLGEIEGHGLLPSP